MGVVAALKSGLSLDSPLGIHLNSLNNVVVTALKFSSWF